MMVFVIRLVKAFCGEFWDGKNPSFVLSKKVID